MYSVFGYCHHILNAATVFALKVDARLDGYNVADLKHCLRAGGKVGRLVDVAADTVTEAVTEASLIARRVYDVARHLVGIGARKSCRKIPSYRGYLLQHASACQAR